MQIALNFAKLSDSTRVITALSKDGVRDQARAMDEAISKLFNNSITEEHWTDRDLRYWRAYETDKNDPHTGVSVDFSIPRDAGSWESNLGHVGQWTITFDYPRPSIFVDWRACGTKKLQLRCLETMDEAKKQVWRDANAGQILNYPISDGTNGLGTIRAYLLQKEWFSTAQVDLAQSKNGSLAANSLCRMIVNEMTGIGLNDFDADLVVRAVIDGMPITNTETLRNAKDCKRSLDPKI